MRNFLIIWPGKFWKFKKGSNCSEFYNGIEGSKTLVVGIHHEPPVYT